MMRRECRLWSRAQRGTAEIVLALGAEGDYGQVEASTLLPRLTVAELNRVLARRDDLGETQLVREFRVWLRG